MSNMFLRSFDLWLQNNQSRFTRKPYYICKRKDHFRIAFEGVVSNISWLISSRGEVMASVDYAGKCWDLLLDFDCVTARAPDRRFYCKLCLEPEYYPTHEKLWEAHSFEPLLQWANETLVTSNNLCLYGNIDAGWTAAEIIMENSSKTDLVDKFPVLTAP